MWLAGVRDRTAQCRSGMAIGQASLQSQMDMFLPTHPSLIRRAVDSIPSDVHLDEDFTCSQAQIRDVITNKAKVRADEPRPA